MSFRLDPQALAQVRKAAERAVADAGEHLLEQANRTVPIEEGTLARSGQATAQGMTTVVSYDSPYAVRQHEDTRLRHDQGRRAKWLQRTFEEESAQVGEFLAERIRRETS